MGDKNEDKSADETTDKIKKHMKDNNIGQSDGLFVNDKGAVTYDKNRDFRKNPTTPRNTPTV